MSNVKKISLKFLLSLPLTAGIVFWSTGYWSEDYFDGVPLFLICHILHFEIFPFLVGLYFYVTLYVFLFFWAGKFGKMKYIFWGVLIVGYVTLNIIAGRFVSFDIRVLEAIIPG
ncbi:MAG: hypothetical protein HYS07_08775 [Chlamydiae bacterium]|nr:hypothetical protein [Chlamydiota bacterium]MBI3276991.1 hypothetical protein [Chlamydiota bacterium]